MARSADSPRLSIIIPALNEASGICELLVPLQPWRRHGLEIILVDGGSTDGTPERAVALVDRLERTPPGRARQMNAGARLAGGDRLWFLHADSSPEAGHLWGLLSLKSPGWGRFDLRLSGRRPLFRLIGALVTLRSRLTGIATGDQGIFVSRALFFRVGGFPDQLLMEDVALSARLRGEHGRPLCLRPALTTDSRRWQRRGAWRTILLMWRLRWLYWRGADPRRLHEIYYRGGRRG